MRTGRLAGAALLIAALLAGCADGEGTDGEGTEPSASPTVTTPAGQTSPPVAPTQSPPTVPRSPGADAEITVSGEVIEGVEAGCVLLRTDQDDYLLLGEAVDQLRFGATATVRGQVRPDLATICQQGTPFEVTEVLD